MAKMPRAKEVSKCSLLLKFRGYAPLKPLGWSGISARAKPGQSEADDVEKHTLAELNYTRASTFLRSALSLWSEAGGCLLLRAVEVGRWQGVGRGALSVSECSRALSRSGSCRRDSISAW